jgi:hypothetical protein
MMGDNLVLKINKNIKISQKRKHKMHTGRFEWGAGYG